MHCAHVKSRAAEWKIIGTSGYPFDSLLPLLWTLHVYPVRLSLTIDRKIETYKFSEKRIHYYYSLSEYHVKWSLYATRRTKHLKNRSDKNSKILFSQKSRRSLWVFRIQTEKRQTRALNRVKNEASVRGNKSLCMYLYKANH